VYIEISQLFKHQGTGWIATNKEFGELKFVELLQSFEMIQRTKKNG
jgi:hypothetical protein